MEQAVLQEKLTSSPFLAGASLPPEQVTAKRFRAGQIISDRPGGVSSVGMIVSGRVEVYSVALDGKDVQLNALTAGECFGVCNLMASAELETVYPVFVGYPARADIVARYDWDNGLCGFVSVSVPEGPSLDFFVPSYGMSRGLCVPGSRVGIAVSGLAIKLGKITSHFIILERL